MTKDKSGGIRGFSVGFGKQGDGNPPEEVASKGPLRIVVFSELAARADFATGPLPAADPLAVDKLAFDRLVATITPALAIELPDPFVPAAPPLRIDLYFRELKELRPDAIVAQVPALRALVDARKIVQAVKERRTSATDARAQLARVLPRPTWADALVSEVTERPAPAPTLAAARTGPPPAPSGLDALLDQVDFVAPAAPADAEPDADAKPRLHDILAAVTGGGRASRPPSAVVGTAPEKVEAAFARVLGGVLRHPEVRRLERAWRGLRFLVDQCDFRAGVEVDVVPVGPEALESAMVRLAERSAEAGRAPVDLFVVDAEVEATAKELERLVKWSELAEGFRAPLVVNGHPSLLGESSLGALARTMRRISSQDDPRAAAMRAVAARESSRWLAIAFNGVLARAAYTQLTSRLRDIPFTEEGVAEANVFVGPAFVVAALAAKSYVRLGWASQITGGRDGVLGNLPVHEVKEDSTHYAIPVETFVAQDALAEVTRSGFIMLTCPANSDAVVLSRAPVVYRGPTVGAREGAPAESTLSDQLFVGRLAGAVEQLAAAIPEGSDPQAIVEVVRVTLAELFATAPPSGPDTEVRIDPQRRQLQVTVRPRRFAGVSVEEVTLGAPLG